MNSASAGKGMFKILKLPNQRKRLISADNGEVYFFYPKTSKWGGVLNHQEPPLSQPGADIN